jgi:hypothetical protein
MGEKSGSIRYTSSRNERTETSFNAKADDFLFWTIVTASVLSLLQGVQTDDAVTLAGSRRAVAQNHVRMEGEPKGSRPAHEVAALRK